MVDLQGAGRGPYYLEAWSEDRAKAAAICALPRAAPEVSGSGRPDGRRHQGELTIFRLLPGAKILPHVGVTNRRWFCGSPSWD